MYFDLKNTLISSAFSVFILNKLYKIVKIKSGKNMIIDNKSRADKSTLVSTEELLINAGVIASSVYGVVGLHPENCLEEFDYKIFDSLPSKIVGIGEIGLDYHYGKEDRDKQIDLFIKQLDIARKYNLPVIIHSRDAINDTINILKNYKDLKKVLHCYSGSIESARELIKLDTYFGVGGVLTFKNSTNLVQTIKKIPLDRIVIETDSPYLSPFRGNKNIPNNVEEVLKKLALIKEISYDDTLEITNSNARYLFNIKEK